MMHKRLAADPIRHQSKKCTQTKECTSGVYLQESTTGVFQMRINFNGFKPFPGWHFDDRAGIEALEDEIAARIEKDHDRPGWW